MLHGATRFNEIRRYLPRISPSLLKARLQSLEARGVAVRVRVNDHGTDGRWYIVIDEDRAEVCDEERALDADVYLTSDRRTLNDTLLGVVSVRDALADGRLLATGAPQLVKNLGKWFAVSPFAGVEQGKATTGPE